MSNAQIPLPHREPDLPGLERESQDANRSPGDDRLWQRLGRQTAQAAPTPPRVLSTAGCSGSDAAEQP